MTTIPLGITSAPTAPRAKTIFYVRAVIALAMIGAWAISAASGIVVWLAADGRGASQVPLLFGATKQTWADFHVAISTLAIVLTITHLTVMRRGVLAYVRLLFTGRRSAVARTARRPKAIVFVRAVVVVTMVSLIPVVVATGIVPWLAADGRRTGQQLLLFALTKHDWADIHTAIAIAAVALAFTHLAVVRSGLVADVRLLATGQRSSPRRVPR
jgi:hypothetical protein